VKVAIVGAGLAGTLLAIRLARRGAQVHVFERNPDLRGRTGRTGASMNLTLVERGLAALDEAGVGGRVRALCVPAYGRVVHVDAERTEYQPYGGAGEALYSVSRGGLNQLLLDAAEATPGVTIRFDARCTHVALDDGHLTFELGSRGERLEVDADLVLGADGVRSVIRSAMQREHGFNFSQLYSSHSNKELRIPAEAAATAGLRLDALHIWPRGDMMLIGFPNPDGSVTCTMHMPSRDGEASFAAIRTEADLAHMFATQFPDAIPLIPDLTREFFAHPELPMVTIRCAPWTHGGKIALIGDAAHAVWPSYGQGANAAFEDCSVLAACLARHEARIDLALAEYEALRRPNTNAIADLSEQHFTEIRSLIRDPRFLLRKRVERRVHALFPAHRSLYERVAFTRTPYAEAVHADAGFRRVVDAVCASSELCADLDAAATERFIRDHMQAA
jgi:kynurenine 3-monooxygenase